MVSLPLPVAPKVARWVLHGQAVHIAFKTAQSSFLLCLWRRPSHPSRWCEGLPAPTDSTNLDHEVLAVCCGTMTPRHSHWCPSLPIQTRLHSNYVRQCAHGSTRNEVEQNARPT